MKASALLNMAFLSAVALAAPAQDAPRSLAKRGWIEEPQSAAGGNAEASVGDGRFRFGHVVPSTTLDALFDACTENGCKPGEPVEVETWYVDNTFGSSRKIQMTVEGDWPSNGNYGDLPHLISLAKGIFEELYNQGGAKREQGVFWRDGVCPWNNPRLCQTWEPETGYTDQWMSTDHVIVRFNDINASLNVGYSYVESGTGGGLCDAVDAAGTFLGLANTWAAGGAGLASLACDAIF